MSAVTVLCDRIADVGGAERYWQTVLPALGARGVHIRLLGREVSDATNFGASARKAEEEWHNTTNHYRVQAFSAAPALNVMPSGDGVEVQIRYITRAYERHEMRKKLYEAVVKLMHGKPEAVQQ